MVKQVHALKIVKRILYLSGLLAEESSDNYPKNSFKISVKTERIIMTKKLFLDPEFTITTLAKEIGTNRTYLSKFFREEKECKFRDYINLLRAEHAKSLLFSFKKYAMEDIAILSGFGSVRALNRSFCKNFGKLPTQYRKEYLTVISKLPLQEYRRTLDLTL